jgi:FlaA1/EpsC-like NDP-sugar epimerase
MMHRDRHRSRALDATVYFFLSAFSVAFAFLVQFQFSLPEAQRATVAGAVFLVILLKPPVFYFSGLHRNLRMFAEVRDMMHLLAASAGASALAAVAAAVFIGRIPLSLWLIDFLVCYLGAVLIRYSARIYHEAISDRYAPKRKGILIYGAGQAGATLLREIRGNRALGVSVAGFLDDDPAKRGALIMQVPVLGCGRQAASIVARLNRRRNRVEEIVIAIPSASGREKREALANCQAAGVPCKTIPGLGELLSGRVLVEQIRDVSVTDLLGRPPVQLDEDPIRAHVAGRSVLVTGAAGSIGSELCLQLARFRPSRIVALDQAESGLFRIENDLRSSHPELNVAAVLADIRNPDRLAEVFDQYGIDAVFHAAAYKHVPMMESHVCEAVQNNVFGTWNLIHAVHQHRVPSFLMISSDKAVNPTNVMGATKRVCELLVSAAPGAREGCFTKCVSVRFGNVLGSNGSVVPIFQAQIAAGGPVCVTHPEIQRYFMTASEAVSLVLQASTIGSGSELFVLDMGEPVRILDLAVNMIRLAGLTPHRDIDIRFTGLRPGEKLFEEINTPAERTLPTHHDKIKIFEQTPPAWAEISSWMNELRVLLARRRQAAMVKHIQKVVPEYRPSERWQDRSPSSSPGPVAAQIPANGFGADRAITALRDAR